MNCPNCNEVLIEINEDMTSQGGPPADMMFCNKCKETFYPSDEEPLLSLDELEGIPDE